MNRSDIIRSTEEIGFLPEQKFGQNFLCDEEMCGRIVDLCAFKEGDKVLEIGPGLGSLTSLLISKGADLTCVEIDKRLAEFIDDHYSCRVFPNDYTKLKPEQYDASVYVNAVSNIPYYVMTPIMKKLLTELKVSEKLVLMVEKDALSRILARPCSKQYGPLAILCVLYGDIDVCFDLPGNLFYPAPKTVSSVITLTGGIKDNVDKDFASFLEKAFGNRRKKLVNNIDADKETTVKILAKYGYGPDTRAEEITPNDILLIYRDIIL